ncbi:MAG TPA: tetratricopeptide repeat protein [Streptosporangiaceae bacterium]
MTGRAQAQQPDSRSQAGLPRDATAIESLPDLALLLRQLRRRDARRRGRPEVTYRELAAKAGWSHATIGEYFTGKALPPTDRFDILIRLLGATPGEQRIFATARDKVEERRRRLAQASQRAGPGLSPGPRPTGPADGRARPVPRQLPPAMRHFAGRAPELAALTSLADHATGEGRQKDRQAAAAVPGPAATGAGGPGAVGGPAGPGQAGADSVVIAVISGTAGVGKTALALHWAHRMADRFPDGQLYVNLRGFDPVGSPVKPAEAVRGFLDALGVPPDQVPSDLDAMTGRYRSLLAERRVLVVIDNARDCSQVRPLLPGSPGCLVVVTSRSRLTELISAEAAQPIPLDLLTTGDARELLARRLGGPRVTAEPAALEEIISACARLPLALSIVAARAVGHPGFTLCALAAELRTARGGLDAFDDGLPGSGVRAVLSWSYRALSGEAARLFRLFGVQPGPDIGLAAVASLAGFPARQVRPALAELAQAHLIAEHIPGRFALHDLLRAYARELAREQDPAASRHRARDRLLDHYLHTAHAAALLLDPHRDPVTLPAPQPGVTPEEPAGLDVAHAWFTSEHAVLLAAIEQAADAGLDQHTWQLAWTLDDFFDLRGHWHDWETTQRAALAAAVRLEDPAAQAGALCSLGRACDRLGRYHDAHRHLQQALSRYDEAGDPVGRAQAHIRLGGLHERQGRYAESLGHGLAALSLYRTAGHEPGQAEALNLAGWSHARLGNHRQAITDCGQALKLQRDLGDHLGEANTWDSLGFIHHRLADYKRAARCYRHALGLFRRLGIPYYEAVTLTHLGDTCQATGDVSGALDAWQAALAIHADMDHGLTDQIRSRADCPGPDQVRARLRQLTDPDSAT